MNHDHEKWLEKCDEVTLNRDGELVTMSSSQPTTPSKKHPQLRAMCSIKKFEKDDFFQKKNDYLKRLFSKKNYFC